MRMVLAEINDQLAKFCQMRDLEDQNGRTERSGQASKIRRQYLQGRIESLETIKNLIIGRLNSRIGDPK